MPHKQPVSTPYLDEDERTIVESFESAIDAGKVRAKSLGELKAIRAEWNQVVANTSAKKAITLRLQQRDIERLKVIARQRGLPYQTLVSSVLHQFANGDLKERG